MALTASRIRWATLAVIYVAFLVWYGGSAEPVSPEEVEKYVALLAERGAKQRAEGRGPERGNFDAGANLRRFLETDDGREFVMLNLNVRRDAPEYVAGAEGAAAIASAAAAEQEYQRPALGSSGRPVSPPCGPRRTRGIRSSTG